MTRARFLTGAWLVLALTLCLGDHFFHLRTGILAYRWAPFVDGQSAWVWLIFAVAAAGFLASAAIVPLSDVPTHVPWPAIADSLTIFVGAYALSGQLGATHPTFLFSTLVIAWLVRVAARPADRPAYFIHGITFAAIGVLGEGTFSMMGLFDYQLQQIVHCPWWLAALYLHGSIALLEIARGAKSAQ